MFVHLRSGIAAFVVSSCFVAVANAAPIQPILASDAYYTFGPNVSANSGSRLLADKAADIGFPSLQSISFLKFDQASLPGSTLKSRNRRALLTLQQDSGLAPTLIPASDGRPVSLSIYGLTAAFDSINGNLGDIDYGIDGASAIATELVGDNGLYRWDITDLVDQWISTPSSNNGFAVSGLFGNTDIDGRNSYGIFHTVGSATGLAPSVIVAVPEPSTFGMLFAGMTVLFLIGRRSRTEHA